MMPAVLQKAGTWALLVPTPTAVEPFNGGGPLGVKQPIPAACTVLHRNEYQWLPEPLSRACYTSHILCAGNSCCKGSITHCAGNDRLLNPDSRVKRPAQTEAGLDGPSRANRCCCGCACFGCCCQGPAHRLVLLPVLLLAGPAAVASSQAASTQTAAARH